MTLHETEVKQETAILVGLITQKQNYEKSLEYLEELSFLAETSGVKTIERFSQRLEKPDTRTFVGKGKLEEIKVFVTIHAVNIVIFDDELSPSQLRNIEKELNCRIMDRSLLILDIFLQRAKSSQAKTQVELARYQYLLPRLTKLWSHLERQRGGTGARGGAGEKEIETDRRIIRDKITLLKEDLKKLDKQNYTQRKLRSKAVRVSLVGYTNVGKSTIMNLLSKSNVFAENKLFATVDSTVRKVTIKDVPFLLTDTVGFIRKLPHTLIECFKSTLDEVRESDLLLHVVDISHPYYEEQIEIVNNTLSEIGASDKDTIMIFNKIDQYQLLKHEQIERSNPSEMEIPSLDQLKLTFIFKQNKTSVFISASKKENIEELKSILYDKLIEKHLMIYPNYL